MHGCYTNLKVKVEGQAEGVRKALDEALSSVLRRGECACSEGVVGNVDVDITVRHDANRLKARYEIRVCTGKHQYRSLEAAAYLLRLISSIRRRLSEVDQATHVYISARLGSEGEKIAEVGYVESLSDADGLVNMHVADLGERYLRDVNIRISWQRNNNRINADLILNLGISDEAEENNGYESDDLEEFLSYASSEAIAILSDTCGRLWTKARRGPSDSQHMAMRFTADSPDHATRLAECILRNLPTVTRVTINQLNFTPILATRRRIAINL